jgi:hypothetical protein
MVGVVRAAIPQADRLYDEHLAELRDERSANSRPNPDPGR